MDDRHGTEVLDAFDRRLDALVPRTSPPADLVRRARTRRTRRRGLLAGAAAAVAVVAVAATAVVLQPTPETRQLELVVPPSSEPAVPDFRTVSYGALSLDVPASWVQDTSDCRSGNPGEPAPLMLRSPVGDGVCAGSALVELFDLDTTVGRVATAQAREQRYVNGVRTLRGGSCLPTAACIYVGRYVVVPDAGVGLLLAGPDGTDAELDRVLGSLRLTVPDGFRLVGLDTVAVAVPEDWVACLVSGGLTFRPPGDDPCGDVLVDYAFVSLTRATDASDQPASTERNGLPLLVTDGCGPTALCLNRFTTTAVAVTEGVRVLVGSPSKALTASVVDSVQLVPAGSTTVPPVDVADGFSVVCGSIGNAGLTLGRGDDVCDAFFVARITGLRPGPGTVLPRGTRVEVLTADD